MADTPAPTLPTKRVIFNKALVLLGSSKRISNPDDAMDADAANFSILWDIARRSAIALHPWNFALKREKLHRETGEPSELGPAYAFRLPPAWLAWKPWDRSSEFWFDAVEEGGFLLCDSDGPLIARGVIDVDDVTRWPPLFVDVMAYTLAIEHCVGKTQTLGLRDRLMNERAEKLDEGFRIDGLSSANRPRPAAPVSRWAGARYRWLGYRG